jgi:hypothetical protein
MATMSFMRQVGSPVTEAQLAPLRPEEEYVQLGQPLKEADYGKVAALLEAHPTVPLRVYFEAPADLAFLKHFPRLRRFINHVHEADDLTALRNVPQLTHLDVDGKASTYDLAPLAGCKELEVVKLEKAKRPEVLAELPALRKVTLVGVQLGQRPVVWPAASVVCLVQHKGVLPSLPAAQHLTITASSLQSLDEVSEMTQLQSLSLFTVRGLASLPDLSRLKHLRRVAIYRARDLKDVTALAAAPSLREVELMQVPLTAADVAPLAKLKGLVRCELQLASKSETKKACQSIAVASGDVDHPYAPFIFSEHRGTWTLALHGPCVAPDVFEAAGHLENGHTWARLAEATLSPHAFTLDCEADTFSMRGRDEAALREAAERLQSLTANDAALAAALRAL